TVCRRARECRRECRLPQGQDRLHDAGRAKSPVSWCSEPKSEVVSMKFSLVVLAAGKQEGQLIPIKRTEFVIGRDPECHLPPASPLISKKHCALIVRDGKAFVRDFGSTNGTSVNDQPVAGEAELHDGDQLKIGPLLFAVKLEVTAVSRPTPPPPTKGAATPAA